MSEFNFNEVVIEEAGSKYFTPGNYVVKTTKVEDGLSSQKQTPYVKVTVADQGGQTCENEYYLSTTVKEGSTKSAMDITAPNLVRLVAAANNLDINTEDGKTKAKALIGSFKTPAELAQKLTTLLVGKPFAIHLGGKWVNPTDTTKKSWIKAEFGSGNFAVPAKDIARLVANPKIKGENASATTPTGTAGIPTATATW